MAYAADVEKNPVEDPYVEDEVFGNYPGTGVLWLTPEMYGGYDGSPPESKYGNDTVHGFGAEVRSHHDSKIGEILAMVEPEDLNKYGLIPEIIGRLPLVSALDELDRDALHTILTVPKDALVKQYQKLFEMDGIELVFEDSALDKVVDISVDKGTGARGLKGVLGKAMMDVMYKVPSLKGVKRVTVSTATIESGEMPVLESEDGVVLKTA